MKATLSLAAGIFLSGLALAQEEQEPRALSDEAVAILREMRTERLLEPGPLSERLATAVGVDCHLLMDVLVLQEVPPLGEESRQRLSEPQEKLVLGAYRLIGRDRVLASIGPESEAAEALSTAERSARILVLGAVGGSWDVRRILDLAEGGEAIEARTVSCLQRAVESISQRDSEACLVLRDGLRRMSPELAIATVCGLDRSVGDAALPVFEEALITRDDLVQVALSKISTFERPESDVGYSLSALVRERLRDQRASVRAQAALAAGALEDPSALSTLIELLSDEDKGVVAGAHHALCAIGGVQLPIAPVSWERWLDSEVVWGRENRRHAYADLASTIPAKRSSALREVLQHRLYRHESVEILRGLLELESAELKLTAVDGLTVLDTRAARASLKLLEELSGSVVSEGAEVALRN